MRVVILSQGFPRHEGDHHKPFVADHAAALAAAGAEVTVVCPSARGLAPSTTFRGVDVVRFRYAPSRWETLAYTGAMHEAARGPRALLLPLFLAGFLVAALRAARGADIVHGHWWAPSGLVAVVVGRLLGVASVVHVHGTDMAIAKGVVRSLARAVLRRADAVAAASSALATWVQEVAGVTATVVPMPVNLGGRDSASVAPPVAGGPVVAVGRLVPEKGFDVLIEAVAQAGRPLVLVGDGSQRATLEALARDLGADVTFTGSLPPAEVMRQYESAGVVAVPSRREGFGLVAAEALAAGRAVVASSVGGLPDIVTPGATGLLVPAGDVDALAHALVTVDPTLGTNGPDSVRWLAPEAIAERTLAVYASAHERVRPPLAPRLARLGAGAFSVVAIVFLVAALAARWEDARDLELTWSWPHAIAAVAAVLVADVAMAWAWGALVRAAGASLDGRAAMRVWWVGQLGRYLPTGLGSVPARVVAGRRFGVAPRVLLTTTAAEPLVIVAVCFAAAALLTGWPAVVLVPMGLVAAALVASVVARVRFSAGLGFTAVHVCQVALRAVGLAALLELFDPIDRPSVITVAGAVGIAYALGFLAVFAPGGIGVREATLAAVLAATTGPTAIAAAAIAWRLLELGVEVPLLLAVRGLRVTSDGAVGDEAGEG